MATSARSKPSRHRAQGPIGNANGLIVPKTEPNLGGGSSRPPVRTETPPESKSWLDRAGELIDKGEIKFLADAKDKVNALIDKGVEASGYNPAAMVAGAIGKAVVTVLAPDNVIDLIPGGKGASGANKARKMAKGLEGAGDAAKASGKVADARPLQKAAGGTGGGRSNRTGKSRGPCDHLKKGNSDGKGPYRGGSYGGTKQSGIESHHTPANAVSPLPKSQGPAVQMNPADHRLTGSHGHQGADGDAYRAALAKLIAEGRWRDAVAMEIKDIRAVAREQGDPRKYNEAISEMLAYFKCLEKHNALPKPR